MYGPRSISEKLGCNQKENDSLPKKWLPVWDINQVSPKNETKTRQGRWTLPQNQAGGGAAAKFLNSTGEEQFLYFPWSLENSLMQEMLQ